MPFFQFLFVYPIFEIIFAPALGHGTLAQLVEQRTENPCVPGSIPGGTTKKPANIVCGFFVLGLPVAQFDIVLQRNYCFPYYKFFIRSEYLCFINNPIPKIPRQKDTKNPTLESDLDSLKS